MTTTILSLKIVKETFLLNTINAFQNQNKIFEIIKMILLS